MALVGVALILATRFASLAIRTDVDATIYLLVINFYLVAAALVLLGSFALERTARYGFLQRLRAEHLVRRVERLAHVDQLTELFNRHHLDSVRRVLADQSRASETGVVLIDIDHFKRFNDTLGHLAGDGCIRAVSDIIRRTLDTDASAGPDQPALGFRYGGEDFLLLIPGAGAERASLVADDIRRQVEGAAMPYPGVGRDAVVTVSVGVSHGQTSEVSLDALINVADVALYRAKQGGRNRIVTLQPDGGHHLAA